MAGTASGTCTTSRRDAGRVRETLLLACGRGGFCPVLAGRLLPQLRQRQEIPGSCRGSPLPSSLLASPGCCAEAS